MLPPAKAPQSVVDHINRIDDALDDVVNHGSDDDLFVASYLQGHYAVIARQVEMQPEATLSLLNDKVMSSLQAAFDNGEVDDSDAKKVNRLWDTLLSA